MGNCLKTQLKESVNNNNLLKFGELRLEVGSGTLTIGAPNTATTILSGVNGTTVNGGDSVTFSGWNGRGSSIAPASGNITGEVSIISKYPIFALYGPIVITDNFKSFAGMDLREFKLEQITSAIGELNIFTLKDLAAACPNLQLLSITGQKITGDISDLYPIKETLTSIEQASLSLNNQITGSFDDLGHFHALATLKTMSYCNIGTVEGFVQNRLSEKPNTAGSINYIWINSIGNITYNNIKLESKANTIISWDANGNITIV